MVNAPLGEVRVSVETNSVIYSGNPAAYVPIPAKYADVNTSGLRATIEQNQQIPLRFDLQSQ